MAGQIGEHQAKTAAVRESNNAKLKNHWRETQEYKVTANLDNVQYLNDVQEQEIDQDATYAAMLDQWSETDMQLQGIFAEQDFAIEDAIVEMYKNSYAGEQTGATAARRASSSVMEMGRKKARALHNKMFAVKEANMAKAKSHRAAKHDSRKLFMNVAFAPIHGFAPAAPEMERGPSKAGLILGLAGSGLQGYKDYKANTAPKVEG